VATVAVNRPDHLEFKNIKAGANQDDAPTVVFQAGSWAADGYTEMGVVVDVFGVEVPILSSADARRLAKWLNRAADLIDGEKSEKKQKHRSHREDDDDDFSHLY
jgi:hypothetical protein